MRRLRVTSPRGCGFARLLAMRFSCLASSDAHELASLLSLGLASRRRRSSASAYSSPSESSTPYARSSAFCLAISAFWLFHHDTFEPLSGFIEQLVSARRVRRRASYVTTTPPRLARLVWGCASLPGAAEHDPPRPVPRCWVRTRKGDKYFRGQDRPRAMRPRPSPRARRGSRRRRL